MILEGGSNEMMQYSHTNYNSVATSPKMIKMRGGDVSKSVNMKSKTLRLQIKDSITLP